MLTAAGASEELMSINSAMLGLFPIVVAITLVGGLIGGVYLLLRSDAGARKWKTFGCRNRSRSNCCHRFPSTMMCKPIPYEPTSTLDDR